MSAGEAPIVVAERLGHSDPSTTHRWHAHAMSRTDARAARLIGQALDEGMPSSVESVRLDPELKERLLRRAEERGVPVSEVIREALRQHLQG